MQKSLHGNLLLFSSYILWSFFPVLSIILLTEVPTLLVASISTFFASIYFGLLLWKKKQVTKLHKMDPEDIKNIFWGSVLVGVFLYGFLFYGAQFTTVNNMAIFMLTEILFTYVVMSLILRGEKFNPIHFLGALCMIIGVLCVLIPKGFNPDIGIWFVILAALCGPFGNHFQKKSVQKLGSTPVMFIRSVFATIVLGLLAWKFNQLKFIPEISLEIWGFFGIIGVLLFGLSKTLFLEGMAKTSVTHAITFSSLNAPLTMVWAYFILHEIPNFWQLIGLFPIMIGIYLIFLPRQNQDKKIN